MTLPTGSTPGLPNMDDVPPSTVAMAAVLADAIRTLAPAYGAIRRSVVGVVPPSVNAAFTSEINGHDHHFTLEIDRVIDGEVKCLASIFCDSYNVAKDDRYLLGRALAANFQVPMDITINQTRLQFTIPVAALF